ncbi:MAG TPA: hypothetical protein P5513_04440 [Candidatus Diapherotrites archaeon]|nr:hypothetical protein [Candidatus Diapherotrites archaeon]
MNKVLSVEMIPFTNPKKMQKELQEITNIKFSVRSGIYNEIKYISFFNFFVGQDVDIYEGELLKVTIFQNGKGKKEFRLENF